MEEIEELRAKAIASMSVSGRPNSKLKSEPIENREEGEISSTDDEELPVCSTSQSTSTVASLAVDADPAAPRNGYTQSLNAGKSLPANVSAGSFDTKLKMPVPQDFAKHFESNPMPSKSSKRYTRGWYVGSEANDNLVISFSDDSASDSEGHKMEETLEMRHDKVRVGGTQPITSFETKSKILQHATSNQIEMTVNKSSSSNKFISSRTKIPGPASRVLAASSELDPRMQRHHTINKNLASRKRRYIRGVNSTDSELASLRQQIAIRENELKLQRKTMPLSKEGVSGSFRDYQAMKLDAKATRTSKPLPVNTVGLAVKEPEKKRIKLDEPSHSKLSGDDQLQMVVSAKESRSTMEKEVSGDSDRLKDGNPMLHVQCAKGSPAATTDSIIDKQQQNNHGQVDSLTMLNRNSTFTPMTSSSEDGAMCQQEMPPRKNTCPEGLNQNPDACGEQMLPVRSDNNLHKYSFHIPESKSKTCDDPNPVGRSSKNIESLLKIEDLRDKELEQAQELRRRCELEERCALRAYRRAQRALLDANERCTYLYRRREDCSAEIQAYIMDNASSLCSSKWHNHQETGFASFDDVSKANVDLLPSLSCQVQDGSASLDQVAYESNDQCMDHAPLNKSYLHLNTPNLGIDPSSEPDASLSDQLHQRDNSAIDGVCTPSNHPSMSADEDEETFPFDRKAVQSTLAGQNEVENLGERELNTNGGSERKSSSENADSELHEASLRSELFARLGERNLFRNSGLEFNRDSGGAKGTKIDAGHKKSEVRGKQLSAFYNESFCEAEHNKMANMTSTEDPGRKKCDLSVSVCDPYHSDNSCYGDGHRKNSIHEENSSPLRSSYRASHSFDFSLPSSVLKIVFSHLKEIILGSCKGHMTSNNQQKYLFSLGDTVNISPYESLLDSLTANAMDECTREGKLDSYTPDPAINPLWAFCMFELRGKCNDNQCPWQHVKDYKYNSASSGGQAGHLSDIRKLTNECGPLHCLHHYIMPVPTYRIGSNLIKADRHSSGHVLARSIWQYWQTGFCTFFSMPFSVQRTLPPNVPSLCAGDGCVEDRQSWNRLALYFRSQDSVMKQVRQGLADCEQSLELALDLFSGSSNKQEGKKKALAVLSRSLEAAPNSVMLWITYLHIFYSREKAIGKDDMFLLAVQHNKSSYELWLMYINSRLQLGDRLDAYDTALSALCCTVLAAKENKFASACILDLFLQMLDFLCMSANVEKAVSRIYELLPSAMDFDDFNYTLLSDVIACLTISDKCILWVCCVYLVIYKKLPEEVLGRLEFEQEQPFGIEWPSTQLNDDEKYRSIKLMEMAVDMVTMGMDGNSYEGDPHRSIQSLAINHFRCVAALEGLNRAKCLLAKYMEQYPTCIELVLTSARLQKVCLEDAGFRGFEEALQNWPKELPGIQCLWNQYAEFVLKYGEVSLAESLMIHWYQSVWEVEDSDIKKVDMHGQGNLYSASEIPSLPSLSAGFHSNARDELFGLLNFSLYKLLLKDQVEARLTLDKALKLASTEDFRHCVKEHALFLLSHGSDLKADVLSTRVPSLLLGYLMDVRAFPHSEPLSRNFCGSIKRPRVRQLLNNLLGPVSVDPSLMNSILEVWCGPSLLPEKFGKLKNLVDFVEALMEILPANYQLALSLCRLVHKLNNSEIVSPPVTFWACSVLVNSIFQASPVAPEQLWLQAADVLGKLQVQAISERFHQQAVSVYPFSVKLWESYFDLCKVTGNVSSVVEAARERGIELR